MKLFTILSMFILSSTFINAQVDAELRIYHKLASQAFQMNTTTQNNLVQDYQITRLEYYVTRITVVHDGAQETAIHDDTLALVRTTDGNYTSIQLGNINVTNVEGVKFNIGVYSPVNNADPSLYPTDHPLAPQAPSMHWGWAAGYRFLVYEGVGGAGFSQTFQFHCLGNANYMETSVTAGGQLFGTDMVIAIDADYTRGMEGIDVSIGLIEHGIDADDLTTIENFRDFVYSASSETITAGITDIAEVSNWTAYPNPTSGNIFIEINSEMDVDYISVVNPLGQEISSVPVYSGATSMVSIEESGIYFLNLMNQGSIISSKRIVKQ